MNPRNLRILAALALSLTQAVEQRALKIRTLLLCIATLVVTQSLLGQTVDKALLDFSTAPAAPANGASSVTSVAAKVAITANISSVTAGSVLIVGGTNPDQFTASLTKPNPAAQETVLCTDAALKNLKCIITNAVAARPDAIALSVTFTPDSAGAKTAFAYFAGAAGESTPLITFKGESDNCSQPYSDCDQHSWLGFSLLAGFEQSYLSSESNEANAFLRAFTKASIPIGVNSSFNTWGVIRDLGAPSANSNQNLVTAIGNPDGTVTTQSLSTVGYSLDFLFGLGFDHPLPKTKGQYSWGPILAAGATTPLSSTSATTGYVVPALGTEECSILQARFASPTAYAKYSSDLVAGTAGQCLYNKAGTGSGSTGTPVTTLAFAGINRSNFLEKYEAGIRTVYRTYTASKQTKCDVDSPCNRGVLDLTVGQDAAITGGELRRFLFKADGVQPFPYSGGYLYIFGTVALRFEKDANLAPLVLTAANSSALQLIPSPKVFVEPFQQPNKDFYRIGVGLSIDKLFKTKTTSSPAPPR